MGLNTISWGFDGSFREIKQTYRVQFPFHGNKEAKITELSLHPAKFEFGLEEMLYARGTKFWESRNRKFVCYNGWDYNRDKYIVSHGFHVSILTEKLNPAAVTKTDGRFMIDIHTYRQMHPKAMLPQQPDELGEDVWNSDEPPEGSFRLLLPSNVYGYNLQEKKWCKCLIPHQTHTLLRHMS